MMYTRLTASDYDDWDTVQESQVGIEALLKKVRKKSSCSADSAIEYQ